MRLGKLSKGLKSAYRGSDVTRRVEHFNGWTDRATTEAVDASRYDHSATVKDYYDLCNEFMTFGWGESLHFAPLTPQESLEDSKIRHQRQIISKLALQPGMTVVDIGCGVGGPMRRVSREAGVKVVGINNNDIQLQKAKTLNAEAGLDCMTDCVACDYMDMGVFEDGTFDRGYAIDRSPHKSPGCAIRRLPFRTAGAGICAHTNPGCWGTCRNRSRRPTGSLWSATRKCRPGCMRRRPPSRRLRLPAPFLRSSRRARRPRYRRRLRKSASPHCVCRETPANRDRSEAYCRARALRRSSPEAPRSDYSIERS